MERRALLALVNLYKKGATIQMRDFTALAGSDPQLAAESRRILEYWRLLTVSRQNPVSRSIAAALLITITPEGEALARSIVSNEDMLKKLPSGLPPEMSRPPERDPRASG